MKYVEFTNVDNWCACTHVTGLYDWKVVLKEFPSLEEIVKQSLKETNSPVLMVTVNETEEKVIEWLKANKFKKGPSFRNWGHNGRHTQPWFYQIPRKVWREVTGMMYEWGDDY